MRKIGDVRRDLRIAYKRLKSWRLVGQEFGISKAMAFRIVEQQYEPKERDIRLALGLDPIRLAPAPVCPDCGRVHVSKRCTAKKAIKRYESLFDLPVGVLRRMIEEREEW